MAYICGIVVKEEREVLRKRGWDLEPCPAELIDLESVEDGESSFEDWVMVWVDSSLFEVMSGPDWDTAETEDPK